MKHNKKQVDYTLYEAERQLKLPMETEILIAADDPVRLVSVVVERMEIEKIERSYSRDGRNEYPPRILLKVLIYAYTRQIYSSREIERACRENICFMYLLEDYPAPDHNTIARFRAERLQGVEKELLEQFVGFLVGWGFVSLATVFIAFKSPAATNVSFARYRHSITSRHRFCIRETKVKRNCFGDFCVTVIT